MSSQKYEPRGKGVLISFDAEWRKSDNLNIDGSKLTQNYSQTFKNWMGQMYPDMYIEAFGFGANMAKNSVYFEMKTRESAEEMKSIVENRFMEELRSGIGASMNISNYNVITESLDKIRSYFATDSIQTKVN